MDKSIGMVRLQPAPDFERLKALMQEEPREVVAQGKHFLLHANPDVLTQARTYNLMCYTAVSLLKRSSMEALFHGHEAVRLAATSPGPEGKALLFDGLVNLGAAAERVGEYARAVTAYQDALSLPLDWIERRHYEEMVMVNMSRALAFSGRYDEALKALDRAGVLAARRGDPYAHEILQTLRAVCYMRTGALDQAQQALQEVASLMNSEIRYELSSRCRHLTQLAVLRMLQGIAEEAREYARGALTIAEEIDDVFTRVEAKLVLAWSAKQSRRVQQATELAGEATREAFAYGCVPLIQTTAWLLGRLYPVAEGNQPC